MQTSLITVMEIGEKWFSYCSGLTGIKLPENLTFMGGSAFERCWKLTGTLYIPESLSIISDNAFYQCTSLTGLVLSDSVTEIGRYAFRGCAGLEGTLNIPDSVTKIGIYAFDRCDSLSRIQIGKGLNQLGGFAFPDGAELGTYSERVWQLLAENTSRLEEGMLVLLWDGRTDIPAGTVVSVWDTVEVNGSITIEPGASVIVDGTLTNNGIIAGEGGFLVNGSVEGNGTVNNTMDIQFTLADIYGDTQESIEDCLYAIEPFIESVMPKCGRGEYYDYSDMEDIENLAEEYLGAA